MFMSRNTRLVEMTFPVKILRLRSSAIFRVFLLFPTVAEIADTPNGKRLSVRGAFIVIFDHPLRRVPDSGSFVRLYHV